MIASPHARILLIAFMLLIPCVATTAQPIVVNEAPPGTSQDSVKIAFTPGGPAAAAGKVQVLLTGPLVALTSNEIAAPAGAECVITVRLVPGANTIQLIGFNPGRVPLGNWAITCAGRWCSDPNSLSPASVAVAGTAPGVALALVAAPVPPALVAAPGAPGSGIVIESPAPDTSFQDETFVKSSIKVTKNTINKVFVRVLNKGKPIAQPENTYIVEKDDAGTPKDIKARIKIGPGKNEISAFDPNAGVAGPDSHTVSVTCTGDECGTENEVVTIPTNSQNTRLLVGFEQVGASSASSATKPFLDLYFNAPFAFNGEVPRLGAWGQIRLATTPEQLTNISVLPSNLVNQLSQSPNTTNLVQSFDFLAGLEARMFTGNGAFQSLIPGFKQKTRFYLAGGGGAISPLSVTRENVNFFNIPPENSPQHQTFIDRYGPLPAKVDGVQLKKTVAFVPLDRDRFLHQWYVGLRLKTYYCADESCTTFKNSFPGMLDLMFGQSESVTGGSKKYAVPDPSDPTKTLGFKNAFVLRFDGFYPLPFKQVNFLYLYGTAIMKIGAGGVKITTPLILDPKIPVPQLDSADVFIPSLERLKSQQPNRDYYKIGVGINLTDLFNRNRTPPQ